MVDACAALARWEVPRGAGLVGERPERRRCERSPLKASEVRAGLVAIKHEHVSSQTFRGGERER